MTTGSRPEERLSAYLDGELSPSEAQEIEAFLRDDPHAAAELEGLREVGAVLRDGANRWTDQVSFDDFYDRVAARVTPRAPAQPTAWQRIRAALASDSRGAWAAAAAVVLLAVGLGSVALLEGDPNGGVVGLPPGAVAIRGAATRIEDLQLGNASAVVYKTPGDVTVVWLSEEEGT